MGKGDRDVRSRVVPGALTGTLSPLAKCFNPERITHVSQEHMENTDMDLHRSLAMTGVGETEPPCLNNIATMGLADSIETEQPVAVADVAEPGGPAVTGTGGPVEWKKKMRPAADRTGASGSRNGRTEAPVTLEFGSRSENVMPASGLAETGTGSPVGIMKERSDVDGSAEIGMQTGTETGEPVVAGTAFTTVAEVYAPISGRKSQEGSDSGGLDPSGDSTMDRTDLNELGKMSGMMESGLCRNQSGNGGHARGNCARGPDVIREVSNTDQRLKLSECSLDCSLDSDSEEENEIMVGVVGSTAPWYLTGWTNDVEVEFMIDTGCQVTILATSVFDKMCDIHPEVHKYRVYRDPLPHPALREGRISKLISLANRAMVIAQLTQLRMAIPASGHAPGEVPLDCFPKLTNVPNTPDRKRVSFATMDKAVGVPSGTAPTEQIGTLSTIDNGPDAHAKSPGTPPGFRPFEWPQAEWDSNGDLQRDPGLPFVASWSARLAEEAMLSPPPLEPMSPIPTMDSQDSMLVQISTPEVDAVTPVVLNQIRSVRRQWTREASSPRTKSGSSASTAEFLFKDILCAV